MKRLLSIILVFLTLASCKKEEPDDPNPVVASSNRLVICNEGNFNWGNASLSLYDYENDEVTQEVFQSANNENLGDVCQSAVYIGDYLYVVVNNSAKIEVLDKNDFTRVATITGFTSPRYIQAVSDSKAYVTDLYADKLWVVDLTNHMISGSIPLTGWAEEMVMANGQLYVANFEQPYLYVVNPENDQLTDSVMVGKGAGSVLSDVDGNLWLTSGGDDTHLPAIIRINSSHEVTRYALSADASPSRMAYDSDGQKIYFLNGDISRFDIATGQIEESFIPANDKIFYGLAFYDERNEVIVSDAKDFVQSSAVYFYSATGEQKTFFKAGINAGWFLPLK